MELFSFSRSLVRLHSSCLPALEAIEDLACKEVTLNKLLRIICMQSLVSSGLKPKLVELYKCNFREVRAQSAPATRTGASEKVLIRMGDKDYEKIYLFPNSHAGYYPGAKMPQVSSPKLKLMSL